MSHDLGPWSTDLVVKAESNRKDSTESKPHISLRQKMRTLR